MLKQRLQNGQISTELPEPTVQSEPNAQSPTTEINAQNVWESGGTGRHFIFYFFEEALELMWVEKIWAAWNPGFCIKEFSQKEMVCSKII